MPHLEVRKINEERIRRMNLAGSRVAIGRAPSNDIVLADTDISREHCVIEIHGGAARILDSGSKYGVRINRQRVKESPLQSGDRIRIGPYEMTFVTPAPAPGSGPGSAPGSGPTPGSMIGSGTGGHGVGDFTEVTPGAASGGGGGGEVHEAIADLRNELSSLRDTIAERERQRDEAINTANELRTGTGGAQSRLAALEVELENTRAERESLRAALEEVRDARARAEAALGQNEAAVTSMTAELRGLREERGAARERITLLQTQLHEARGRPIQEPISPPEVAVPAERPAELVSPMHGDSSSIPNTPEPIVPVQELLVSDDDEPLRPRARARDGGLWIALAVMAFVAVLAILLLT